MLRVDRCMVPTCGLLGPSWGTLLPRNISPRPRAVEPSAAAASAPPLLAGRVATIIGLVSRPELVQDKTSGRWICRVKGGEQLRLLPVRLVPIAETGQQFSRLRYDAS